MIMFEGVEFFDVQSLKVYLYKLPMIYCNNHITIAGESLYVSCADISLLELKSQLIDFIIEKVATRSIVFGCTGFTGTKEELKKDVFAKIDGSDIHFIEDKPRVFGIEIKDGGAIKEMIENIKIRIGEEIDKL